MKIKFICGCGFKLNTWGDLFCHFKYRKRGSLRQQMTIWQCFKLLLQTKIKVVK